MLVEDAVVTQPDWEHFYRHLREPGFLEGYQILGLLGHGTFGVVYKARKLSVGRPVAVKFLKVDDPVTGEAVMRELGSLEYLAQLDHPNLVSIEDQGSVDGIPYIVMGYAGEETLALKLGEEGPLPPAEAAGLLAQVCSGVQALHDHGFVHFDIKPANIFLKGGRPRLGDYGLARLITATRRTLSFGRGTPLYMAPELLDRKGDERSDIYSLGVVLFETVTGKPPFSGESEWEVMRKHEKEPLRFPRGFPKSLRPVVSRAMAKKPGDRYSSASEMGSALVRAGADLPLYAFSRKEASGKGSGGTRVGRKKGAGGKGRKAAVEGPFPGEEGGGEREEAPGFLDWFLGLPGRLLRITFKLSFRIFGFALELFVLVFVLSILIRVLGRVLESLFKITF